MCSFLLMLCTIKIYNNKYCVVNDSSLGVYKKDNISRKVFSILATMYHYVLRSPYALLNINWADIKTYWEYTRYRSIAFDNLEDMVDHYKRQIDNNYLDPNPQFYYQNTLMANSDDIFYGLDEASFPPGITDADDTVDYIDIDSSSC